MKKKKKTSPLSYLKSFISKNVNPPEKGFVTRFWPREMKIAKELAAKYPDMDFWRNFSMPFKVNSLAWFKTKRGEEMLDKRYKEFHFKPQKKTSEFEVSDEKVGESTYNGPRKKVLSDFLS